MDIRAKIQEDMRSLGCTSAKKITLTCFLYTHLVDEKLMYDTEYCYNKDIDVLYVVARPSRKAKLNIYVPVTTSDPLSMEIINKMQVNLCTVETGPTINLAFIEMDFTNVIYMVTRGIVEKPTPEVLQKQNERDERRRYINSQLKKNKSVIANNALNGGVVDDDDCEILE